MADRARPAPSTSAGADPRRGGASSSPAAASMRCRVSDIADEAQVAYGLVYHYFRSKEEVLDTLFLERWNVLLAVDLRRRGPPTSCPRARSFTRSPRSSWTPTATTPI